MHQFRLMHTGFVCLLVLSFSACQKEISEPSLTSEEIASANGFDQGGSCKMTSNVVDFNNGEFFQLDEFTYQNGRLDEWFASYGGSYRMQYDQKGRMKRAVYVFDDQEINYIDFVYEQNRVVKEIWTDPATGDLVDEVTNEYNQRGLIVSSASVAFDYLALYDRDQKGNVTRWRLYLSGALNQQGDYTYKNDVRNPYKTVHGLAYLFGYANGAFLTGPNTYSSERVTLFDENGSPAVLWDLDPEQTQFDLRAGRFPSSGSFIDQLSSATYLLQFAFDACGNGSNKRSVRSNPGKNKPGPKDKYARPLGY